MLLAVLLWLETASDFSKAAWTAMGRMCRQPLTCGRLAGSRPCPCFGL